MNKLALFALLMLLSLVQASIPIYLYSGVNSNLTNFPARVDIASSSLLNSTHCANVKFYDSDNITELAFDVDYCDLSMHKITYWVRIPNLTPTKTIYAQFQPLNTNNENVSGVWGPAGYVFVWHANNLSVDYGNTTGLEQIGSDCNFGPHNYCFAGKCVYVGLGQCYFRNYSSSGLPTQTDSFTQSLYLYLTQQLPVYGNSGYFVGGVIGYGSESDGNSAYLLIYTNPNYILGHHTYGIGYPSSVISFTNHSNIPLWVYGYRLGNYIGVGYNGASTSTYIANWVLSSNNLMILAHRPGAIKDMSSDADNFYADEARISSFSRSSDWLLAEQNQISLPISNYSAYNFSYNNLPFSTFMNKSYYFSFLNASYNISKIPIRYFANSTNNWIYLDNTFNSLYGLVEFTGDVYCGSVNYTGFFYIGGKGNLVDIYSTFENYSCEAPIRLVGAGTIIIEPSTDILQTPEYSPSNVFPTNASLYRNTFYQNNSIVYSNGTGNYDLNDYYSINANFSCTGIAKYGGNTIAPEIYYDNSSGYFIPDPYNPANYQIRFRNNSILYFYDYQYDRWFYALPISCNSATVYNLTLYLMHYYINASLYTHTPQPIPYNLLLNKKYYIAKLNSSYYTPKIHLRVFANYSSGNITLDNNLNTLYGLFLFDGLVVCNGVDKEFNGLVGGSGDRVLLFYDYVNNIYDICFAPTRLIGKVFYIYAEPLSDTLQTPAYSPSNVVPIEAGIYRNTKHYNKTIVYYYNGSNIDLNSYYSNTSNFPCRALLVYGDKILTPDVYYDINSGYFIPDIVEPTTNYVRLRNNTVLYFYDFDYNSWFYAPSFICDPNYVYTISAYVYEQSAYSAPIHLPKIYLKKNCYINGSSYVIDIYTSSPSDFGVYVNGTLDYSGASYALSKSYNANSNITVKDGNNILCHHEVGKYAYFFTDMFSPNIVKLIGGVFTVLLVAIGLVYPTASLGIIVLNDMFQMMRVADAVFISLIVVAASVLTRITRRSLKNIGFYLGLMFVGVVYLVANYGNTYSSPYTVDISELQAANQEWEQFSSSLAEGGDVIAIILGGLTLLFSLLVLLLKLPLIIWHIILAPVFYINPYLYAGMVSLGQIITIGVGVYAIVLLYITWQRVFIEP
ncbi:MAG: hypothetical protein ABIK73_07320 [candidate division WOR-3 bacterium]